MSRKVVMRFSAFLPMILILCLTANAEAQTKAEAPTPDEPFKFESKVRVVLVPVLVLDARGDAVGHLTQKDFEVFDQGKQQVISRFTVQMRSGEPEASQEASNAIRPQEPAISEKLPVQRHIVFLFDDVHLDSSDFVHVRKAASRMLAGSLSSSDIAAVLSTSGRVNTGFTRDQERLREAIMKLRQDRSYINPMRGCPDINYYQAYDSLSTRSGRASGPCR